jgi:hypothetical protein
VALAWVETAGVTNKNLPIAGLGAIGEIKSVNQPNQPKKKHEINDDPGCGFCRRTDDDHRLLDLLQKG